MSVIRFFASLILLVCLTPLLIFISILIVLIDKESPYYLSKRIGKGGNIFLMPKFRTMSSSTPQKSTATLEKPEDYLLVTGRFLRKYSLDELPQIFSILKGDMVFVGPRPALYNQFDLITLRKKKDIDTIKPGITGWAQVNGRDELSIKDKVKYDEEYLDQASIPFDLRIIFLTFLKVIKKDGVSH